MPTELRKLTFSEDELRTAAVRHCLRLHIRMPQGNVDGIEIGAKPEAALSLRFQSEQPEGADRVDLTMDQVGAALIRYCREQEIPLPRIGRKLLRAEENGYALLINIH